MPDDLEIITTPVAVQDLPTTRHLRYVCSSCGRNVGRDNLKVKRVQFKEMGANGPIVCTRTVAWLCVIPLEANHPDYVAEGDLRSCLDRDADYNRPRHLKAPGLANTKLTRDVDALADEAADLGLDVADLQPET